jgi:hypothetical protein
MNSRRRSYRPMQLRGGRRQQPPAVLLAAVRVGAAAAGAAAIGAGAVGALAIGRLAIGRAVVRRLKIEDLEVTRLHVHELRVDQQPAAAQPAVPPASQTYPWSGTAAPTRRPPEALDRGPGRPDGMRAVGELLFGRSRGRALHWSSLLGGHPLQRRPEGGPDLAGGTGVRLDQLAVPQVPGGRPPARGCRWRGRGRGSGHAHRPPAPGSPRPASAAPG